MNPPNLAPAPESAELLRQYQAGNQQAAEEIFERYAERLTRLARSRLAAKLAARVDPEDIVLSAYRSFFVAARQGRFSAERPGDLWRLLVEVTLHKLYRQAQRHQAARRSIAREQPGVEASPWLELAAGEPTSEQAAIAAEELAALLAELPPRARPVVELRLQGYEQLEIAAQLKCSERTVRRWLEAARKILAKRAGSDSVLVQPRTTTRIKRQFSPCLSPSEPGHLQWSDFVLKQQIGAGATGKVYRAIERGTGRPVAVKFLKKSLAREQAAIDQFLRELHTVAELRHPGIVAVQGIGRTPGGGYFLVMELIGGSDLHSLPGTRPIPVRSVAGWIAAAASILHFAHERGIIHCDLKPSNLLLDEQGQIRVTDFGLSVRLADTLSGPLLAGTPAFMAPEQVDRCWGPLSPRTDVWGLGAVLYFLLCGQPPHTGETVADVLAHVVSGRPVALARSTDAAAAPLIEVCRRCLTKDQGQRYASAAELAAALDLD